MQCIYIGEAGASCCPHLARQHEAAALKGSKRMGQMLEAGILPSGNIIALCVSLEHFEFVRFACSFGGMVDAILST